jgi:photosystem II stability/assembly factor-like uncharacterized protein
MEALYKLREKISWPGIGMLIMVALLMCACGNQSSSQSTVISNMPTTSATSKEGSQTVSSTATVNAAHIESSKPLTSIRMVSQLVGWAIAEKTTVLRTTDGGNHWIDVTPHYSDAPTEITPTFVDGLHAWIGFVGTWDQSPITILRTSDGGQSWQWATIAANQPTGVVSLQFRGNNYQQGWVLAGIGGGPGAGHEGFGLYTTTNGGQSWSALPSIYTSDQIGGLSFLDTTTGFLAFGGPYATPQLSVTHDGGRTWKNLSLPAVPGVPGGADEYFTTPPVFFGTSGFLPVYFSSAMSSGKAGPQGFVMYTTSDGGATWVAKDYRTLLAVGGPLAPSDLYIVDPTHFYVTDQQGATWLSTNGGASWTKLAGTVGNGVTSLSFTDDLHGWAAGSGLWRTTDGGRSWQAVNYIMLAV